MTSSPWAAVQRSAGSKHSSIVHLFPFAWCQHRATVVNTQTHTQATFDRLFQRCML